MDVFIHYRRRWEWWCGCRPRRRFQPSRCSRLCDPGGPTRYEGCRPSALSHTGPWSPGSTRGLAGVTSSKKKCKYPQFVLSPNRNCATTVSQGVDSQLAGHTAAWPAGPQSHWAQMDSSRWRGTLRTTMKSSAYVTGEEEHSSRVQYICEPKHGCTHGARTLVLVSI